MTPRRITHANILRILIFGFALAMVLLIVAGLVGVRSVRSIRDNVAHLVGEQLLTARLINEIQVEQSTLNAVFYRLTRASESTDWDALTAQLEAADQDVARIVSAAAGTSDREVWSRLHQAARAFSTEARRLIAQRSVEPGSLRTLFALNDEVIHRVTRLVAAGSARVTALQGRIEAESRGSVNRSLELLGSCLVLALLCAFLTVKMATASFREMEWQASELSRVSWHMLQGQEAAARRFSHELHDELGQSLAAVKANLTSLNPETLPAAKADCVHLVDQSISNVRELSQLLRPVILDDFGLDAAIHWLAEKFTQRTRIQVEYTAGFRHRIGEETETHLFRIAQEALTNVARHSGATTVRVDLDKIGDRIRLRVADNGRGLPQEATRAEHGSNGGSAGGLGLVGMRARARHAGGELSLLTTPGGGLMVEALVPYSEERDGATQEDASSAGR